MSQSLDLPWDPKLSHVLVKRSIWGVLIDFDTVSFELFALMVVVSVIVVRVVHAVGGVEGGRGC